MEEKHTVVTISTKSWHYRFMKFMMGSSAPTPQNMFNLCPYFWLLVLMIIIAPVYAPLKLIYLSLSYIKNKFYNFIIKRFFEPNAISWENNLTDEQAFQIYENIYSSNNKDISLSYYRVHHRENKSLYKIRKKLLASWFRKKYNADFENFKSGTITKEFYDWLNKKYEKHSNDIKNKYDKKEKLAKLKKDKYENSLVFKIVNKIKKLANSIKWSIEWGTLIKWSKRLVGLIITISLLIVTYFLINVITLGVLCLISVWSWSIAFNVLLIIGGAALFTGLCLGFSYLIEYLIRKARTPDKWYYSVLHYLGYGIKWLFVNLIWKGIIINFVSFIVSASILLWKAFLGFLGIFGEYFGASYNDYCPGIEWKEEQNN